MLHFFTNLFKFLFGIVPDLLLAFGEQSQLLIHLLILSHQLAFDHLCNLFLETVFIGDLRVKSALFFTVLPVDTRQIDDSPLELSHDVPAGIQVEQAFEDGLFLVLVNDVSGSDLLVAANVRDDDLGVVPQEEQA